MTSPQPRVRVLQMPEYHPPLGNRDRMRLDFNENTLGCSPAVLAAIRNMSAAELTRYPERGPVEALAAESLGLDAEQVILTNGVDEAIHVLCHAFLDAEDELLLPVPTYTMYEIYASSTDAKIIHVPSFSKQSGSYAQTPVDFAFPKEAILAAVTPQTKLIALANPNSPTGATISREDILTIANAAPHAVILIDEAYYHFFGETVMDLVGTGPGKLPNLIVARTYSKAYGLASLRLGLLAGPVELLHWCRRVLSPYSVNSVALTALTAALHDQTYLDWYVAQVKQARTEFLAALTKLGIEFWPTEANFVLLKIGPAHKQFVAAMNSHNILVRDRSADPGCEGLVRITIGTPDQMRHALPTIEDFIQSQPPLSSSAVLSS
jgi:histidinol-phosphate aminotransferase